MSTDPRKDTQNGFPADPPPSTDALQPGELRLARLVGLDPTRVRLSDTGPVLTVRRLCELPHDPLGRTVVLALDPADPAHPLVLGWVRDDPPAPAIPEEQHLQASKRLRLSVGPSSLVLEADGTVTLRGVWLESHASAENHLTGAAISLN